MHRPSPTSLRPAALVLIGLAATACGDPPPRVEARESGLQIEHLREGTGPSPEPGRYVAIHYVARTTEGTVVDDSLSRDEAFLFGLTEPLLVIPGLAEGVQAMRAGGRALLTLPPELAYGSVGKSKQIPPDTTLIYDVELLEVLPKTESGLHYHVIEAGEGDRPKVGDHVVLRVRGRVESTGREFLDPKLARDFEMVIGREVLKRGVDEGLTLLRPGARAVLIVPPELGYGLIGFLPRVPPGQNIRFEIEFLGVRHNR